MRSGIRTGLIVVAACTCVAAAERPAQFSNGDILIIGTGDPNAPALPPGDPNETWDAAQHLVPSWMSVSATMTSRLDNPAEGFSREISGPDWSLALTGRITVIDSNGLVGLCPITGSALALDQDGRVVSSTPAGDMSLRWYQQPCPVMRPTGTGGEWVSTLEFHHFSVSLPMEPNVSYPSLLSRVEWSMYALVAGEFKTVDIPFAARDTWVELAPGMKILVEQALAEGTKYEYRIKMKYDTTKADYLQGGSVHLWRDQVLPPAVVLNMEVLNPAGQSIHDLGGGSFHGSGSYTISNNQVTGTTSGSGDCSACGTAATFRYTLASQLREQPVRLVLENIPVPSF